MARALLQTVPGGDVMTEVGPAVLDYFWDLFSSETNGPPKAAHLAAMAQAAPQTVRDLIEQVLDDIAPDLPEAMRQQLGTTLMRLQGNLRLSLRRASDPSGTTVPANLILRRSSDLHALFGTRASGLYPGHRPFAHGDLELVELLGVGGFGEVWKARNIYRPNARPVALKFCLDPETKTLINEARVLDELDRVQRHGRSHPGFVQLLNTHLSASPPCLEYEYIEGGDLGALIQEWHRAGGPDPSQAAKVLLRLAEIVGFAHEHGIIHRDLKPANVLIHLGPDRERQFKIADFGIGTLTGRSGSNSAGTKLATGELHAYTSQYASPQQIRGVAPDRRDDVYALGVIWLQLLNGDLNQGCPTGSSWQHELARRGMPRKLIELLDSCIDADPARRPRDAGELSQRVKTALDEGDAREQTTRQPERTDKGDSQPPEPSWGTKLVTALIHSFRDSSGKTVSRRAMLVGGVVAILLIIGIVSARKRDPVVGRWVDTSTGMILELAADGTMTGSNPKTSWWGSWKRSGNTLTLLFMSSGGYIDQMTIEYLDASRLVVNTKMMGRMQFSRDTSMGGK
jgi:serine/threonine protein kinase